LLQEVARGASIASRYYAGGCGRWMGGGGGQGIKTTIPSRTGERKKDTAAGGFAYA